MTRASVLPETHTLSHSPGDGTLLEICICLFEVFDPAVDLPFQFPEGWRGSDRRSDVASVSTHTDVMSPLLTAVDTLHASGVCYMTDSS